jgi:hypothetical protein
MRDVHRRGNWWSVNPILVATKQFVPANATETLTVSFADTSLSIPIGDLIIILASFFCS